MKKSIVLAVCLIAGFTFAASAAKVKPPSHQKFWEAEARAQRARVEAVEAALFWWARDCLPPHAKKPCR